MTTNPTAVNPPTYAMSAAEQQTLDFNMAADLVPGDAVTAVAVALTNYDTGAALTLSYAFTLASPVITQTLDPAADGMVAGSTYRLRITYTAYPSLNIFVRDLLVIVSD